MQLFCTIPKPTVFALASLIVAWTAFNQLLGRGLMLTTSSPGSTSNGRRAPTVAPTAQPRPHNNSYWVIKAHPSPPCMNSDTPRTAAHMKILLQLAYGAKEHFHCGVVVIPSSRDCQLTIGSRHHAAVGRLDWRYRRAARA